MKLIKNPTQKEMLEQFSSSSVHCIKCNYDIGNLKGKNCPNCDFDMDESVALWILENLK